MGFSFFSFLCDALVTGLSFRQTHFCFLFFILRYQSLFRLMSLKSFCIHLVYLSRSCHKGVCRSNEWRNTHFQFSRGLCVQSDVNFVINCVLLSIFLSISFKMVLSTTFQLSFRLPLGIFFL